MSEKEFDYRQLDTIIHSRIRLMIMSILLSAEEITFKHLKEQTCTTDGNLSIHLSKLDDVGYIEINKAFVDKKPQTTYKLTETGRKAMSEYVKTLKDIIDL